MDRSKIKIKQSFIDHFSQLTDYDAFIKASLEYLRRSVRINTLKIDIKTCKKRLEKLGWKLTPVPWCKEGFWVEHKTGRRDIGNTIEHALGYIYVQEAASMIPPVVLGVKKGEKVLDMCASPGSKASQLSQYLDNTGVLVANDYKGMRLAPLGLNMQRVGSVNNALTVMHGQWFKDMEFDKVLVDAPCSGTGTIAKSLKTLDIWNPHMIDKLARQQKKLLLAGWKVLKKGGTLVYSTCSVEPQENEGVVSWLLGEVDDAKVEEIKLDIKQGEAITSYGDETYSDEVKNCLRLWPQDNMTEGFFVAKLKKA
tara:strand:+ start:5710 stop:6639 length:930 start_codon:yes stop_codon:yes gene_type:complete